MIFVFAMMSWNVSRQGLQDDTETTDSSALQDIAFTPCHYFTSAIKKNSLEAWEIPFPFLLLAHSRFEPWLRPRHQMVSIKSLISRTMTVLLAEAKKSRS